MELNITDQTSRSSIEIGKNSKGYTKKVKLYYDRSKETAAEVLAEHEQIMLKLEERFPGGATNGK